MAFTIVKKESDLRKWVHDATDPYSKWIEAAPGGTDGMPDTWLPLASCGGMWLELKRGFIQDNGDVKYKLQPMQKPVALDLISYGQLVFYLVGVADDFMAILIDANEQGVLDGTIKQGKGKRLFLDKKDPRRHLTSAMEMAGLLAFEGFKKCKG